MLNGRRMPRFRLTRAIVNVNLISHVLKVIMGRNSYITSKGFWTPGLSGRRHIACILECLVCSVQEYALLRIHTLGFARADLEKPKMGEDRFKMIM